jgi:hypothetical protein
MTNKKFNMKAEEYVHTRDYFRNLAAQKFLSHHKDANVLVASMGELIASMVTFLSGQDIREVKEGEYIVKLVVSFCRSYFIAVDLTLHGELIEAAVIVRKQMEVLSRLNELTSDLDMNLLINKPPNLKHLKGALKKQYDAYSKVAHSSSLEGMALLGREVTEGGIFTPLYPYFQEDAYVSLHHLLLTGFEFFMWAMGFYRLYFPDYDSSYDLRYFSLVIDRHQKIFPQKP